MGLVGKLDLRIMIDFPVMMDNTWMTHNTHLESVYIFI